MLNTKVIKLVKKGDLLAFGGLQMKTLKTVTEHSKDLNIVNNITDDCN